VLVASQVPVAAEAIDAQARRSMGIVALLVTIVCVVRTAMFTWLSRTAARAIDDATVALDRAPDARQLLVIDLPASAALAFPHAVRLGRPTRTIDVQILSLSPRVMPDATDVSAVAIVAPDRFELRRESGYLNSYLERALEGPMVTWVTGRIVERLGYSVTVSDVDRGTGRPKALAVHIDEPKETLIVRNSAEGLAAISSNP
jgi:hypothetical protein